MTKTRFLLVVAAGVALWLAGCSRGDSDGDGCEVEVDYSTDSLDAVVATATPIRVFATVRGVTAIPRYRWTVLRDNEVLVADADTAAIDFVADRADIYRVQLTVTLASSQTVCPVHSRVLNVRRPGAAEQSYRLRITVPAGSSSGAVPQEFRVQIPNGSNFSYGPLLLDTTAVVTTTVRGETAMAAKVRFLAEATGSTVAEPSSGDDGVLRVTLGAGPYDVLVLPSNPSLAPITITRWDQRRDLEVPRGLAVTGEVRDPDNQAVVGARVSLRTAATATSAGTPSTIGLVGGDARFALQARAGAEVELTVMPPPSSPWPRLTGTLSALDLDQPILIRYAAIDRRDLGTPTLQRMGTPVAGEVTFFADLPTAAMVNGARPLRGTLAVSTSASANGRLAAIEVPQMLLSALLQPATGRPAVLAVDASAPILPATLNAGLMVVTGTVAAGAIAASGAVVTLLPLGTLAHSGAAVLSTTANADGAFSIDVAAGGRYRALIGDPRARGARTSLAFETAGRMTPLSLGTITLGTGFRLEGVALRSGAQPVAGAAIELLCDSCLGLERDRPISEATSADDGGFSVVVPETPDR